MKFWVLVPVPVPVTVQKANFELVPVNFQNTVPVPVPLSVEFEIWVTVPAVTVCYQETVSVPVHARMNSFFYFPPNSIINVNFFFTCCLVFFRGRVFF